MKSAWIYLSGPMTGIKNLNRPAFHRAAKRLRDRGYEVINPAELKSFAVWGDCLRRDLVYLVKCHAIATLPRWYKSKGANLEVHVGRELSMPVHPVSYYLKNGRKLCGTLGSM